MNIQANYNLIPFKFKEEIRRNAKVKILPNDRYKITCFKHRGFQEKGYELRKSDFIEHQDVTKAPTEKNEAESRERTDSLKRTKDKIFEISLANHWKYMVTFTLDKEKIDRYDPKEVKKCVCNWLYNQSKRRNLSYLVVPELHQDGAIHFHGLTNEALETTFSETFLIKGVKMKPIKETTLRKKGYKPTDEQVKKVYNVNNFPYGFTTAVELDENCEGVARYMTKYITKDLHKFFGNYYFCGGDVKRELPSFLVNLKYEAIENAVEVPIPVINSAVKYFTCSGDEINRFLELTQ